MPYLVGPDPDRHLFGPDGGAPNTPDGILQIQADYAIGDIKGIIVLQYQENQILGTYMMY